VTLNEVRRSARRPLEGVPLHAANQRVLDAMVPLENALWVARIDDDLRRGSVVWHVNPALATIHKDHREKVVRAKQRQLDAKFRHARNGFRAHAIGFESVGD
jgi:hypothetical protein